MNAKLHLISVLAASLTLHGAAMPTETEVENAVPKVERMLASEKVALASGKMTRAEVAETAMKLAAGADDEAAKLLLMKGAFILHVKDGDLEKAVKTMNALETAIADMPPQIITNIIETALLGLPNKKASGARLYRILDETKMVLVSQDRVKELISVDESGLSSTEKTRKAVAKLFPGWSLDTEVAHHDNAGLQSCHRGQGNVVFVHPLNRETPAILSRTVTLSNKNPCLYLKVASWAEDADWLLSVRVNGKDTLSNRLICTSDITPWEDLVVPLFAWRGSEVKIEIVLKANNWWCEFPFLARLEIAEGNGQERCGLAGITEGKATIDGYTWSYRVRNGEATIVSETDGRYSCAVSPNPTGHIVIPATLGGVKVTSIGREALCGCRGIQSVIIPSGVKHVEWCAFKDCNGLASVTFPSSVTSIERGAFYGCAGLTSVTFPAGVTKIGRDSFLHCRGLKSVTIPPHVKNIDWGSFKDCRNLESVTIPEGVTNIANFAFMDCNGLKSLAIPPSVRNIGWGAFARCGGLATVSIPFGVECIDGCAFENCGGLTSVTIPSSVKILGERVFDGCSKLASVSIPKSVTSIDVDAFKGTPFYDTVPDGMVILGGGVLYKYKGECPASVMIPSGVTRIGREAFFKCGGLTSVTIPEGVESIEFNAFCDCGSLTSVTFPLGLKNIGRGAFGRCRGLSAVTIPSGVTNIGMDAFCGCTGLKTVEISASVTNIESTAFYDCSALASVRVDEGNPFYKVENGLLLTKDGKTLVCGVNADAEIPMGVTCIADSAFRGRGGLKSVRIPTSVVRIGGCAFYGCGGLKSVEIPSNVTSIGWGAFCNCKGLESVSIPSNVTSIDGCAFWGCGGLKSVTIPRGVKRIGDRAFWGCGRLTSLALPQGLESIEINAFRGLEKLTSVTIPASVTRVGGAVFSYCSGLKEIKVEADNQKYVSVDGVLYTKDRKELVMVPCGLTSVALSEELTSIGLGAFIGCGALKSVTIPSNVKSIGKWAFEGCNGLSSVTIPASVTSIGQCAFLNCRGLTSITMDGECPSSKKDIFHGCRNLKSIHVPANCKSWARMKKWQGIPLVFDGAQQGQAREQREAERAEQRAQLIAIQEELRKAREARVSGTVPVKDSSIDQDELREAREARESGAAAVEDSSPEVHKAVESILKGMIKVPGRDYWLSATEVTQEQWEPIMGYNLSEHKGAKLPVETVSRNDCDVFLEKLNQTKEVQESQFELCLPTIEEWRYAAQAGGSGNDCWIKPGVVGNVLDMAWMKPNSSNETHVVATKAANAFGFYDMFGNVWEWTSGYDEKGHGRRKGCSFDSDPNVGWMLNCWIWIRDLNGRGGRDGLRLAAHQKPRTVSGALRRLFRHRLQQRQEAQKTAQQQETVNGYTWSFRVNNGEAEIVADEKLRCAISSSPTGHVAIPLMLGGAKVTSIGREVFKGCRGVSSVTIPECVRSIERAAFYDCGNLASVTLPQGLVSIGANAFMGCRKLAPVTIPLSVTNIGEAAFAYCLEMKHLDVEVGNRAFTSIDGVVYTKDRAELVVCPSGMTSVAIPDSVMKIRSGSFTGCEGLTSLTIPPSVKSIGEWAFSGSRLTSLTLPQGLSAIEDATFWGCHNLTEVTIPDSVTSIGGNAFRWCGKLTSLTIPKGVKSIGGEAFYDCGGLSSITMCGERPEAPNNVFKGCRNLKSIHVPANAKSWAWMKEWQGIPLVFDGEAKGVPEMTPVAREFKIGVAPGTVVEVDIGGCPLQFVSCPAGKFRMGYSEKSEVAACREIEISSPFWMTKGRLTVEQLRALGVQEGVTENKEGFACVDEASLMVEKLPQLLNKRFEGRAPEGYVFRLPTEAEFEYVQKAGAVGNDPRLAWGYGDDNDSVPNPWGIQKLFYAGRKDCFLDRVGGGKDVVSRFARNTHWTDLVSINYENQPSRDPVGWCEGNRWAVLRRVRNRKLTGRRLYGSTFYFVLAPDESRLNKFIWR